jgi:hypothetical protein
MTVTIASTTDTEQQVVDATNVANDATSETQPETTAAASDESAPVAEDAPVEDALESPDEAIEVSGSEASDEQSVTDPDPEEAPAEASAPKRKRRRRGRSYKDRASQLAREKATETARADALEARLRALENTELPQAPRAESEPDTPPVNEEETVETSPPTAEAGSEGRPTQENFETYDEYQEALLDWKVTQRLQAHTVEQRDRIERQETQRAQEQLVATHTARIDQFRAEHSDFDAVVEKGKNLPMTRPMQDSVLNSDAGPALMYHLCQNPEECDRIAGMHPMQAIKEMGKLEARLEVAQSGPTPRAESITRAPRPIKPVGGGVTASSVPLDQMSYQDYKRAREQQIEGRHRS